MKKKEDQGGLKKKDEETKDKQKFDFLKKDKKDKKELSKQQLRSNIWGIDSLNDDNFSDGFSFVVKSLKWLRKVEGIPIYGGYCRY